MKVHIYRDNGRVITAYCPELDVIAIGDTQREAVKLLGELIEDLVAATIEDAYNIEPALPLEEIRKKLSL